MIGTRTLWVDCDGTLILWPYQKAYADLYGTPVVEAARLDVDFDREPKPNTPLIEAVHEFARVANVRVVVWSGGGRWYAQRWAEMHLSGVFTEAVAKDPTLPQVGDFIVDDEEYRPRCGIHRGPVIEAGPANGAVVLKPEEFVELVKR